MVNPAKTVHSRLCCRYRLISEIPLVRKCIIFSFSVSRRICMCANAVVLWPFTDIVPLSHTSNIREIMFLDTCQPSMDITDNNMQSYMCQRRNYCSFVVNEMHFLYIMKKCSKNKLAERNVFLMCQNGKFILEYQPCVASCEEGSAFRDIFLPILKLLGLLH